jgi:hypothetical protein
MSLDRTLNEKSADSPIGPASAEAQPEKQQAGEGWMGRFLPPRGFERKAFLVLTALVLVMKVLAIQHYRANEDEMQHAHVVWGWTKGHLQYRDIFDNHMPLFHMACAPLMALLGERADILVALRWAMLPLYLVCVWAVFKLTETLFSRRIAPWVALAAAALPKFFYSSTEFRPDDLWAAFWLLGLLVAVSGEFTIKRAFGFGLLLGLTAAVSIKTVVLAAGLFTAVGLALALAWLRREGPGVPEIAARLTVIVLAAVIPPAATVFYFAWQGAFWNMYYCVIAHNVVPDLKRWGDLSHHAWYFPLSLIPLGACAWLIFRQTPDTRLAMKRAIVVLTPWFYLFLLLSYMPDITREDDLPYAPLTPLLAVPLLLWLKTHFKFPRVEAKFFTWIVPAVCFAELVWTWNVDKLRRDHMKVTTQSIRDVLSLTDPNDDVMDRSGDYIFRMRCYYWAFETVTKERIRDHLIPDHLPEALEKTETKICSLSSAHMLKKTTLFMLSNYLPVDPAEPDLGVAGKNLGSSSPDGTYSFDVAIPETYAVVSESGTTAGTLDGADYAGPVRLEAGRHLFHRTSGTGLAAILLHRAVAEGFRPLFDLSRRVTKSVENR